MNIIMANNSIFNKLKAFNIYTNNYLKNHHHLQATLEWLLKKESILYMFDIFVLFMSDDSIFTPLNFKNKIKKLI